MSKPERPVPKAGAIMVSFHLLRGWHRWWYRRGRPPSIFDLVHLIPTMAEDYVGSCACAVHLPLACLAKPSVESCKGFFSSRQGRIRSLALALVKAAALAIFQSLAQAQQRSSSPQNAHTQQR